MPSPSLPPQAYTREMLSQAYAWLQVQPEAVRKLATNSDALVALFLRYQRYGDLGIGRSGSMPTPEETRDLFSASPATLEFRSEIRSMADEFGGNAPPASFDSNHFMPGGPRPLAEGSPSGVAYRANSTRSSGGGEPDHDTGFRSCAATATSQATSMSQAAAMAAATNSISINLLNVQPTASASNQPALSNTPSLAKALDNTSWELVQKVQTGLNLSSEVEACRVLIKMGYDKLKTIVE